MRIGLALLMTLHGFAHLVGFMVPWQLGPVGGSYKTTLLAGQLDIGNTGIRMVGVFWLAGALGFWIARDEPHRLAGREDRRLREHRPARRAPGSATLRNAVVSCYTE